MEIILIASVRMHQMGLRVTGLPAQAPLLSPLPLDEPQHKLLFTCHAAKYCCTSPKTQGGNSELESKFPAMEDLISH